ncbi:Protein-lysine methyltransferase METTL21C, partial [Clarias magur]
CKGIVMETAECTDKENIMKTEKEAEDEKSKEDDPSGVECQKAWEPNFYCIINREIHYYAGHEIKILEALDSFGAITWPAGQALCQYLDSNRRTINLQDKAVLELGAGTGLVSIVASLLGAWVTASDLPEVLGNLQSNLCRNTRGYCRYTPQVAALSWGYDLEQTFPQSVYRYDYVLAADVVYHHDFLEELLVTMRHFCQPGTTLIWANKIRFRSDLLFTKNFKKTFNTTLLEDMGKIKIYSATMKDPDVDVEDDCPEILLEDAVEQENETEDDISMKQDQYPDEDESNANGRGEESQGTCEEAHDFERNGRLPIQSPCTPSTNYNLVYNFKGHKICTEIPNDGIVSPAAMALCKFLESPAGQEQIVLHDQTVLDLYAGAGLLSIVATLLGAKVTAMDQTERLENLRGNLSRNTRGHQRHEPQVTALTPDMEQNFPRSTCQYDYVMAAGMLDNHECFTELMVTMRLFCQPGTNLIWAIKVCYPSDLLFIEDFYKLFQTTMLAKLDGVRIFLGTNRANEGMSAEEEMEVCTSMSDHPEEEISTKDEGQCDQDEEDECEEEEDAGGNDREYGSSEKWEASQDDSEPESFSTAQDEGLESDKQVFCQKIWESKFFPSPSKETHYFMGHKIIIEESIDSYGGLIWPAAVALCKFLETPEGWQQINLLDKTVLEIGAGTGLLSIALTLL